MTSLTGRIFSGIQPSGELHIGNYLGAVKNWVALQQDYECIYCVVDYHAITQEIDPRILPKRIMGAALDFLACGIDPSRSKVFVQSDRPEHTELAWILSTVTPLGLMERMTQFKEKSGEDAARANLGLYCYPVLQAADILIYRADTVPVGEDQAQHLEVTRDIARKFNLRFGATFPEPKTLLSPAPRVIGLDGAKKMSKSLGNHIALSDPPDVVKKKLAVATTDPARKRRSDPGNPDICNIYSLHKFFSAPEEIAMVGVECRRAGIGCLDCKGILAKNVSAELAPIQTRRAELLARPDSVRDILRTAAAELAPVARATLDEVRAKVGVGS